LHVNAIPDQKHHNTPSMMTCRCLGIVVTICVHGWILFLSNPVFGFHIPVRPAVKRQQRPPLLLPAVAARSYQRRNTLTQVISDVDDTLKSSGGVQVAGVYLGGVDVQYPRGAYYPGVAEFLLHLGGRQTKLAILTARAEEFKIWLELKPDSSLAQALARAGEVAGTPGWGIGPVLYGSVAEWILQDRKGWRKFDNFERLIRQDDDDTTSTRPMRYIYVGDTGELDEQAGTVMLREYADIVKAVFLHVVSDQPGPVTVPPLRFINGRPLVYFRTYVGAALAAVELGFMGKEGLQSVVDAAREQLAATGEPTGSDKWLDLEYDVDRARTIVK
jgi:hypothetical protein